MKLVDKLNKLEDQISPGISACIGCNVELTLRTVMKVIGPDSVLAVPPGCMGGVGVVGWGDKSGSKTPVFFPLLDNTASMLAGIKAYYNRIGKKSHVVAFAGDGATVDAGFQALSGAAERGENIIYICYDNEGYMNTGFQRSGSTSMGSWTSTTPVGSKAKGKKQHRKDGPLIMAMHGTPYVATASPAYINDLVEKVEKAKQVKEGLAYIHVLNPCSTGWGYSPEDSIQVARAAVKSRFFPLYEVENGKFKITQDVKKPIPVSDYVKMSKKYKHLGEEEVKELQEFVDEHWKRINALAAL